MTIPNDRPQTILAHYANGLALLESALTGLTEADLDLSLSADSWTVRQIIHHIADGDDLWKTCLKAALGNSEGSFTLIWYWEKPQLEWSESWAYASRDIQSSLALLRANRLHIQDLIEHIPGACEKSIFLTQPEKPGVRITVLEILEMQAQHVMGHINDLQAILHAHEKG